MIETLRKKVNERGPKGILGLAKCFGVGDRSKASGITVDEFKLILKGYKLGFDDVDVETVFKDLDANHDSLVNFREFVAKIRGELSPLREELVNKAFDALDPNRDGKVKLADIKSRYNPAKHPAVLDGRKADKQVSEEFVGTLEMFTSAYGLSESDTLTRDEFAQYYANISTSIDKDDYFAVMIKNTWNLEATDTSAVPEPTTKAVGSKTPKKTAAEMMSFGGESKESPFKKSIADSAAENPLVKKVQLVNVEAPYYTTEEMKKSGNVFTEKPLEQRTDNLVLGRFRSAMMARGVRGILVMERQFATYAKEGALELEGFKQAVEDFRLSVDSKDLGTLFKALDTDMDNKVNYSEFIKPVVGELSMRRKEFVSQAFKLIDTDGDGKISKDDIARVFDGLRHPDVKQGKKTQEDLLHEIFDVLDLSTQIHVLFHNVTRA